MKNSIPTNRVQLRTCLRILCVALFLNPCQGWAEELTASQRGYRNLTTKAYLPSDFDQDIFDDLWTVWEEPLRSRAEKATVDSRRAMAMERYGLLPQQKLPSHALQYVVAPNGNWAMSCLACHQGQVAGKIFPGLPNTNYALETLTEEVRSIKIRQQKSLGHMDLGSLLMPLGPTNGTTNAVMFGVALMRYRDKDLNIVARPFSFDMVHHDVDAPAWWHYAKRDRIYADGFAPKGHRILMQFLLVKENGPLQFAAWEDDFRDIEAWLLELKSPPWEWEVDTASASVGRHLFENLVNKQNMARMQPAQMKLRGFREAGLGWAGLVWAGSADGEDCSQTECSLRPWTCTPSPELAGRGWGARRKQAEVQLYL